jgi:RHS repeat-associated protein
MKQFQYDANNRMKRVAYLDDVEIERAVYDGLGQRVQTISNNVTRNLVSDIFGRLVAEYGGEAVQNDGGGVKYMMADHQGSTRVVMKQDASVLARRDYLPFGEELKAGVGMRTTAQGYQPSGGAETEATRQKYAGMERDKSGLDHAEWRKYESQSGRWTSADPYLGSMNVSNPQSFNRYAYVENDPVNLIDPSGLSDEPPEPWDPRDTIVINGWGRLWENHGVGGGGHTVLSHMSNARTGEDSGSSNLQNTECQRFASIVEQIANDAANADDFMQRMVNRFIGPNLNVRSGQDFDRAANVGTSEFGSGGFKPKFVDDSNQVRHFTGGLWAGYLFGPGIAQLGMNSNENNSLGTGRGVIGSAGGILPWIFPADDAKADVALNSVSVPLGTSLTPRREEIVDRGDRGGWRRIPGNLGYRGLAGEIRRQVCE